MYYQNINNMRGLYQKMIKYDLSWLKTYLKIIKFNLTNGHKKIYYKIMPASGKFTIFMNYTSNTILYFESSTSFAVQTYPQVPHPHLSRH